MKPLAVRVVTRRGYQFSEKTLPEIFVGNMENGEAWARNKGLDRIWIFPKDESAAGSELSEVTITWLENFQSRFNPALANDDQATIKRYVASLLQTELEETMIDTTQPQGEKRNAASEKKKAAAEKKRKVTLEKKKRVVSGRGSGMSKKKQKKGGSKQDIEDLSHVTDDSGIDDHEIVAQYEKSDRVPDRMSAERIGRAKGRIALNGTPIPGELIMGIKETALKANISPWFVWGYCKFVMSLPNPPHPQRATLSSTRFPQTSMGAVATTSDTPRSHSSAEPTGLGTPYAQLIRAFRERDVETLKSRPWIPTLEKAMAAYDGLPEFKQ